MPRSPSLARVLARGLTKRCPRCGQGKLFTRWATIVDACPRCGLRFEREEGHWLAAVVINMGVTQIIVVAYVVLSLVVTWPDPPLWPLIGIGGALVAAFALFFLPFSKTTWHGIELWMRRHSAEDTADVDRP